VRYAGLERGWRAVVKLQGHARLCETGTTAIVVLHAVRTSNKNIKNAAKQNAERRSIQYVQWRTAQQPFQGPGLLTAEAPVTTATAIDVARCSGRLGVKPASTPSACWTLRPRILARFQGCATRLETWCNILDVGQGGSRVVELLVQGYHLFWRGRTVWDSVD
jgi:hypothetical protein